MDKQRFFIDTQGNDYKAYKDAILLACKLADSNSAIKKIILLVHAKQNAVLFTNVFNDQLAKKLSTVGTTFDDYKTLVKIETLSTYKDIHQASDVVITCMLDSEQVFTIDDFYGVNTIIAVPWLKDGIDKWAKTWKATEIRTQQDAIAYSDPSSVIIKALEILTESVNLSNHATFHPSDEDSVKTYIRALKKYEPFIDADIVRAYLVRELNWGSGLANKIEELINTLNSGGSFKGGQTTGLKDYYDMWK